jgi:hypothetical protein
MTGSEPQALVASLVVQVHSVLQAWGAFQGLLAQQNVMQAAGMQAPQHQRAS